MSAWDRLNDKLAAEQASRALDEALGRGRNGRAYALLLAGNWYIVTSETGGGARDLAYDAGDVDASEVSREGWDYSAWVVDMVPCTDRRVATEYYLREACLLGDGTGALVLTDTEIRALGIAMDVTRDTHTHPRDAELRAALMDCAHVATAGKDLDAVRAEINAINREALGPLPHVRADQKGGA